MNKRENQWLDVRTVGLNPYSIRLGNVVILESLLQMNKQFAIEDSFHNCDSNFSPINEPVSGDLIRDYSRMLHDPEVSHKSSNTRVKAKVQYMGAEELIKPNANRNIIEATSSSNQMHLNSVRRLQSANWSEIEDDLLVKLCASFFKTAQQK